MLPTWERHEFSWHFNCACVWETMVLSCCEPEMFNSFLEKSYWFTEAVFWICPVTEVNVQANLEEMSQISCVWQRCLFCQSWLGDVLLTWPRRLHCSVIGHRSIILYIIAYTYVFHSEGSVLKSPHEYNKGKFSQFDTFRKMLQSEGRNPPHKGILRD